MRALSYKSGLAAVCLSLALAPAALASGGGVNSGGVNSGGLDSGGSGGGGGGGKVCTISTLTNRVGYYSIWAAIWTSFSVTGCPSGSTWEMSFHNDATGNVDFSSGGGTSSSGGGGAASATVDEDWAAFSTPYTVTLSVRDSAGNTVASKSSPALTPDLK